MSIEFFTTVFILCVTLSASIILLKFWMDFKLQVWDRENSIKYFKYAIERDARKELRLKKNLYNKKKPKDIIIDCDAEVINSTDLNYNTVKKKRLLK